MGCTVRYLQNAGLNPEAVVLANVAMCGLASDGDFDQSMAAKCLDRHGRAWLAALLPDVVILMGGASKAQRQVLASLVDPSTRFFETMHYAVGGSHRAKLSEQLRAVRVALGSSDQADKPQTNETAKLHLKLMPKQ